jgi:hypothetical protein
MNLKRQMIRVMAEFSSQLPTENQCSIYHHLWNGSFAKPLSLYLGFERDNLMSVSWVESMFGSMGLSNNDMELFGLTLGGGLTSQASFRLRYIQCGNMSAIISARFVKRNWGKRKMLTQSQFDQLNDIVTIVDEKKAELDGQFNPNDETYKTAFIKLGPFPESEEFGKKILKELTKFETGSQKPNITFFDDCKIVPVDESYTPIRGAWYSSRRHLEIYLGSIYYTASVNIKNRSSVITNLLDLRREYKYLLIDTIAHEFKHSLQFYANEEMNEDSTYANSKLEAEADNYAGSFIYHLKQNRQDLLQ